MRAAPTRRATRGGSPPLPWHELDTVFLDAGNTLVAIDVAFVARELAARGLPCEPDALVRAQAAARPSISQRARSGRSTEGRDALTWSIAATLARLPAAARLASAARDALAAELAPVLRGRGPRLWSRVLPGVPAALAALRAAGLRLAVVSNSDGSVEGLLAEVGLRDALDAVHDSHVVGFEKPDPRIFEHALRAAGAEASRALHVGDLYDVDVAGARAAGLHAVLLDPFGDWEGADCERLADLPALAARIVSARR